MYFEVKVERLRVEKGSQEQGNLFECFWVMFIGIYVLRQGVYKGHGGNAKKRQVCDVVGVKAEVMRKGKTERLEKRHEAVCICAGYESKRFGCAGYYYLDSSCVVCLVRDVEFCV